MATNKRQEIEDDLKTMVSTRRTMMCLLLSPFKGEGYFWGLKWGGSHYFSPPLHNVSAIPQLNNDRSLIIKHHSKYLKFSFNQNSFLLNTYTVHLTRGNTHCFPFFGLLLYFGSSWLKQFIRLFTNLKSQCGILITHQNAYAVFCWK